MSIQPINMIERIHLKCHITSYLQYFDYTFLIVVNINSFEDLGVFAST